ncbi:MAG: peptidylprolyl isomerase [Saprospiraceae bacterium]|nr:peptidylprolyl isomerase [Saprospiraceae bacterium]
MAVIGKIRSKSGLLLIIIGAALASFVLGDFIKGGGNSREVVNVAEIGDETISRNDFFQEVEKLTELRKQQNKQDQLTAEEAFQIRQQAWTQIKRKYIMLKEYEELGLAISHDIAIGPSISKEEFEDLIFGQNPHSVILNNFKDQKTGQYSPANVTKFLNDVEQARNSQEITPEQREQVNLQWSQWLQIEEYIYADRLSTKYNNLIKKAYYVPEVFAKRDYEEKNKIAKFRYFGKKYDLIPDSTVVLSDDDYENYYEEHKNEFEQEASRDIDYVIYEVTASRDDITAIEKEVGKVYQELQNVKVEDIYNFVNRIPDNRYDSSWIKQGALPLAIDSIMFNSEIGTVVAPYRDQNAYQLAKLIDVQTRPDSMRASHILIAYAGATRAEEGVTRTKLAAEALVDSILEVVKFEPHKFEEFASTISNDASAREKMGDLNWFADGMMVPEFNNACLNGNVGDVVKVETPFGFHLLKVTGKKDISTKVRVAQIHFNIEPSDATYDYYWKLASEFIGKNRTEAAFESSVAEQGLSVRKAEYVTAMANNIPGLESPREIIQWAFNKDIKAGTVSDKIFEIDNKYVIAVLKEIREKGIATLEQKKESIKPYVLRDKKAQIMIEDFNSKIATAKDINKLASAFNLKVDTADFIKFAYVNLQQNGPEPAVIGSVFGSQKGLMSAPIKGAQAVYVFVVDEFVEAPEIEDYSMTKAEITRTFESRILNEVFQALEKNTEIIDNRINFY